jgi:fumarate hydratase class II
MQIAEYTLHIRQTISNNMSNLFNKKLSCDAAISTGYVSAEEFDKIVVPKNMVGNPHKDLGLT